MRYGFFRLSPLSIGIRYIYRSFSNDIISPMESSKLRFFKDILEGKINQLLGSAGKTLSQMIKEGDPFPDPVDRAMSESGRNIELRKRDRERKLIQKITKAIQRTEDGTYGICEECGNEISESRLRVRPEATLCIKCKEEQEEIEKQFGS